MEKVRKVNSLTRSDYETCNYRLLELLRLLYFPIKTIQDLGSTQHNLVQKSHAGCTSKKAGSEIYLRRLVPHCLPTHD